MLLSFRTANVRSLRDEQELSFTVPSDAKSDNARPLELSDGKTLQVYPVLGVFGANASGKSNVIFALQKMKEAVVNSYGRWTSYEGIPVRSSRSTRRWPPSPHSSKLTSSSTTVCGGRTGSNSVPDGWSQVAALLPQGTPSGVAGP